MRSTVADDPEGVHYPRDAGGHTSTTRTAKAILAAAFSAGQTVQVHGMQLAMQQETAWRRRYPVHFRALCVGGAAEPAFSVTSAQHGLDEAWRQFKFVRNGVAMGLRAAMNDPQPRIVSMEHRGRGASEVQPWSLPYRGRDLQGQEVRDLMGTWQDAGVVEPGHAQAIGRVLDHPEWFDLSDQYLVLLGAGAEAGPLSWLAKWRTNIVAVDMPSSRIWKKITDKVDQGNARLIAPVFAGRQNRSDWVRHAGASLLTHTPEIGAWLANMSPKLSIASLAYLDGERHVRVVMAMDAICQTVFDAKTDTGRMFLGTPTDVFVVPQTVAEAVMARFDERSRLSRSAVGPMRMISGGRWLRPHIENLIQSSDGNRYGLVDALVIEQGPNYALAKRLQQWRAVVTRAQHNHVSYNVAPSTSTKSVLKNPALKAGFDGAHRFGMEVFEPATTNALMAAMWVHDLRCKDSIANPRTALNHPLEQLTHTANHGGLWRSAYLPRSALPLAAMMGFLAPGRAIAPAVGHQPAQGEHDAPS